MKNTGKQQISFESEGVIMEEAKASFSSLIDILKKDETYAKYQFHITKMFDFFKEEYEKNMKLLSYAQEMNAQIVLTASKINVIRNSTFADAESLSNLKKEFDEATNMVQSVHKSEIRAKKILADLRNQIQILTNRVSNGEAFSFGTDQSIFEVSNEVKNLKDETNKAKKECQQIQDQIQEEKKGLELCTSKNTILASEETKITKTISQIDKRHQSLDQENQETSQTILEMKPVIDDMQKKIEDIQKQKEMKQQNIQKIKASTVEVNGQFNAAKDEARARHDKIQKRQSKLHEILKISAHKTTTKENLKEKIKNVGDEIQTLNGKLAEENKKVLENNKLIEIEIQKSDEIQKQRLVVRQKIKELRPIIIDALQKISSGESESAVANRQLSTLKSQITSIKQEDSEYVHQANEIKNTNVTLKSETLAVKNQMQQQKDKIIGIFSEIDNMRTQTYKMQANLLAVQDSNKVLVTENEKLMKEHATLLKKTEQQEELSETLREERNNYARLYKSKEEENANLQQSINELDIQINDYIHENKRLFKGTIDSHFNTRSTNDEIEGLEEEIKQMTSQIHKVERVTSHLQAENHTLSFIIDEAAMDHIMLKKERHTLENNLSTLNENLRKKNIEKDEIRSQIQSQIKLISSCQYQYNEKIKELEALHNELETHSKATEALEKKAEAVNNLIYQKQRISNSLVVENRKYVVLMHELAIMRNVHRWQVIEAVDPYYVRQIRYRMQLSNKLGKAFQELEKLEKERDELKETIAKMSEKHNQALTREQAQQYIDRYKQDIKQKEAEMAEMEIEIKKSLNPMKQGAKDITVMRTKVNQRRESASSIKNEIYQSMRSQSSDCWFITEGSTLGTCFDQTYQAPPQMAGGGFAVIITPPAVTRKGTRSNILRVGPSPAVSRHSHSGFKVTSRSYNSTQTYHNKNTLLPSINDL